MIPPFCDYLLEIVYLLMMLFVGTCGGASLVSPRPVRCRDAAGESRTGCAIVLVDRRI